MKDIVIVVLKKNYDNNKMTKVEGKKNQKIMKKCSSLKKKE